MWPARGYPPWTVDQASDPLLCPHRCLVLGTRPMSTSMPWASTWTSGWSSSAPSGSLSWGWAMMMGSECPPPPPHSHGVRTNWGTRGEGGRGGRRKALCQRASCQASAGAQEGSPHPRLCSAPSSWLSQPRGKLPWVAQTLRLLPGASAYTPEQLSSCVGPGLPGPGSFPPLASLEEDFITWREQFWPAVCEHFGVEATGEESR